MMEETNEDLYVEQEDPYKAWQLYVHQLNIEKSRWQSKAACRNTKPGVMFPARSDQQRVVADLYCSACEMRTECLYFALVAKEEFGVWGGTTESQRVQIQKAIVKDGHGSYRSQWNKDHKDYISDLTARLLNV